MECSRGLGWLVMFWSEAEERREVWGRAAIRCEAEKRREMSCSVACIGLDRCETETWYEVSCSGAESRGVVL
jgi:hypothetical protein